MSNPWFRFYAEFAHDPKVQIMSEPMQRRLVMLMCLRCSNVTVTLRVTEIAFALRVTDVELAETKALFIGQGFIDEQWNLVNWDKRQFASDSSAARVARHREKLRQASNVTAPLPKRPSNVLDTDTDTDKKKKKNLYSNEFERFWSAYPKNKKVGKAAAAKKFAALNGRTDATLPLILAALEWQKKSERWTRDGGQYVPDPERYLSKERWLDEPTGDSAQNERYL